MVTVIFDFIFVLSVFFLLMPAVAIGLAAAAMLVRQIKGDGVEHPMHLATREFYGDRLEKSSAH